MCHSILDIILQVTHHCGMRTTLSLDDDVLQEARSYAKSRDVAIGKAVSDLIRRGLRAPLQTRVVNGFHVVELPPGSPPVSTEDVGKLQDELE
jgi:Arc/MetJ family transcription regulator